MRERFCCEETRLPESFVTAWAIIDRRNGYQYPIGYILEAVLAQQIVDVMNKGIAYDQVVARPSE